jgi:D-xylose transport system substrate-binding protein
MNGLLWRSAALAVALSVGVGVFQAGAAAKADEWPAKVAGIYTFVSPTDTAAGIQSVTLQAAGTKPVKGTFSWTVAATGTDISGSVTCVQVVGQDAWVAGTIKKPNRWESADRGILFRIHGDDASPLGFETATIPESGPTAAFADCTAMETSGDAGLAPMLSGHITVAPAGLDVDQFDATFSAMAPLAGTTAAGNGMVGVILPGPDWGPRFATFDLPNLTKAFTAAGYKKGAFRIDFASATTNELALAQADIAAGATVLIVFAGDPTTGASIKAAADAAHVPYISYIKATFQGTNAYHVGFDDVRIGRIIGQRFIGCVTAWGVSSPRVFTLDGDQSLDPAAVDFATGYNSVIWGQAVAHVADGATNGLGYTLVHEQNVPYWDNATAEDIFRQAYTADRSINATVEANDGLANAVISVLRGQIDGGPINGAPVNPRTIPVTGQDATVDGMANILLNFQCGSIYKPVYLEAQAAVALATYLRAGQTPPDALVNGTTTDPADPTIVEPAVLLRGYWVDAANMEATVIKDGWVSVTDLCNIVGADLCKAAGIK